MDTAVPFNRPYIAGKEMYYIAQAVLGGRSSGDGPFTKKCNTFIENLLDAPKALLTQSYGSALDMAAMLCNIQPGDEVIMPSFAFVSVANAFYMQGAVPVFVDIRPDTLNLNESLVQDAVTSRTRVIVVPHYAGVGCEMDTILNIAQENNLLVVEDAANGFGATYKDKYLGTMGDLGVLSFHETNSIMCGEGGALLVNNERFMEQAEIIREKGTNRSKFLRGEVDKYTWVSLGSSFLPSDLVAAFLYAQLEMADTIIRHRSRLRDLYVTGLQELADKGLIRLPVTDATDRAGGRQVMYVITRSLSERNRLIHHLETNHIKAIFHYIPLHSSPMGKKFSRTHGDIVNTIRVSDCIVRLPLFNEMQENDVHRVMEAFHEFYRENRLSS
ncbi:MAG: dTDP-4-amino-4,6-dideoxygalactose transaminase [Desulfobacter postgatei]|uniref:dTDP-4-amino-4,6-dideoxygalactose transaminase n=1 Tax=Desulfobacter postgatei TaxID=2293 RepID=UPI0023F24CBF|nr:dTDP-4-amino-4,6-dideoxygalactose transaminase [Desulfobacter postgatei]MDD4273158.1 dTDP-4-amino-4,6-dideoxygalactose transaminase [Desulfobacter postgatei]